MCVACRVGCTKGVRLRVISLCRARSSARLVCPVEEGPGNAAVNLHTLALCSAHRRMTDLSAFSVGVSPGSAWPGMGLGESVAAEAAFLAGPGCRTRPVMDVTSYISFPGFPQQLDHQENFLKVVDPVAEDTPCGRVEGLGKRGFRRAPWDTVQWDHISTRWVVVTGVAFPSELQRNLEIPGL